MELQSFVANSLALQRGDQFKLSLNLSVIVYINVSDYYDEWDQVRDEKSGVVNRLKNIAITAPKITDLI